MLVLSYLVLVGSPRLKVILDTGTSTLAGPSATVGQFADSIGAKAIVAGEEYVDLAPLLSCRSSLEFIPFMMANLPLALLFDIFITNITRAMIPLHR